MKTNEQSMKKVKEWMDRFNAPVNKKRYLKRCARMVKAAIPQSDGRISITFSKEPLYKEKCLLQNWFDKLINVHMNGSWTVGGFIKKDGELSKYIEESKNPHWLIPHIISFLGGVVGGIIV